MCEIIESGNCIGWRSINYSLGIMQGVWDNPELERHKQNLLHCLYKLWAENKIKFYRVVENIGNKKKLESIYPKLLDDCTIEHYNGMIFKLEEIANNLDELKVMLRLDTTQAIQEEKLFLSFLQNYPQIEIMFELYKQGKNRKEIGDAVYKKSNSQSITGFLISPDSKNVSNSGWQKIYTNLVKGKSG